VGLLDKFIRGANKVEEVASDAEDAVFHSHKYDAAAKLAERGAPGTAIVTGIRGRFNDDTTQMVFRLEWNDGAVHEGAVEYFNPPASLRLGSEVMIRTDGGAVVLDPDAMSSGVAAPRDPGTKKRGAPDRGINDKALDMRVLSHLKKWTPERAVIASWEATTVMGMATENWNIVVTREDGSTASTSKDNVPNYARWFAYPGLDVPIVVDPGKPDHMQVDWPGVAEEQAGGTWSDTPPPGSIAESRLTPASAAAPTAMATEFDEPLDLTPSAESADAIEGVTIETWAKVEATLTMNPIPPAEYDAFATEHFGVPAGRWTAIVAAWNQRMRTDWKVGAAFGEAYEAAQKQLKQKR
jgi:hypothetical protein